MSSSNLRHTTRLFLTREQVEAEIHHTLLKYDGLVESAATNQGAWLTESAGALSDLHAAVLRSLGGFSTCKSSSAASRNCVMSAGAGGEAGPALEQAAVPAEAEASSGGKAVSTPKGETTTHDRPTYRREGDRNACVEDHSISSGGDVVPNDAATCTGDGMRDAAISQESKTATKTTTSATGRSIMHIDKRRECRRARLQHLGLLLARKRQFAASRQVYIYVPEDRSRRLLFVPAADELPTHARRTIIFYTVSYYCPT